MTADDNPVGSFLDAFFSPPNEIVPGQALEPWMRLLRRGESTVLPVRRDGQLTFYGLSSSPAAGRGLAEDLVASVGPSWSGFEGAAAALDPDDATEAAIIASPHAAQGGPTFRLRVAPSHEAPTWSALERMRRSWARRPAPRDSDVLLAPLPDVLRDVELALQTLAVDEATRLVHVLRRRGDLDSQNLLFLDLRLLAASGRVQDVLHHPRLDDVLSTRRPVGVTAMLLGTLDAAFFAAPAAASDAEAALSVFRERVAGRFAQLLDSSADLTSAAALQFRVLAAVDALASEEELASLVGLADASVAPWLKTLAALAVERRRAEPSEAPPLVAPVAAPTHTAREALYEGQHGRVLELLANVPVSAEVVDLMVNAAVALGTVHAATAATGAFLRLEPGEQQALRRHPILADPLEGILALSAGAEAVRSWSGWLARLAHDAPFEQALPIAEVGAVEWPTAEPESEEAAQALATALTTVPDRARRTLERAVPYMLAYFDRRPVPDDLALPVLGAVLEVFSYGESRTRAVREAFLAVVDPLLHGTPGPGLYGDVVESIEVIWADVRAVRTLSWLADVLALLAAHACPLPERRIHLMSLGINEAMTMRDVDRTDLEFLIMLALDPVFDGAFASEVEALEQLLKGVEESSPAAPLEVGRLTVGIYTLSPTAARHAQAVLHRRFPSVEIELNHEKDGSPLLRAFAQRADILAVVIASAKHAATNALRESCRPDAFLQVGTKGTTGLVRAISGRIEELVSS